MTSHDTLLCALERLQHEVSESAPLIADILRRSREGEITQEVAVREIWITASEDATLAALVEDILLRSFALDSTVTSLARLPDRDHLLERWGFTEEDLLFQPHPDRSRKMLNPIFLGMIVELLQFDGDVLEFRTERLPEGGAPAVPVRTTARDPVTVGAMLRMARADVFEDLQTAQREHDLKLSGVIEAVGAVNEAAILMVRRETDRAIGIPGYRPGSAPQMRDVEEPSGEQLARFSFEERQQLAHVALTSTQGRKSIAPVIEQILLESFSALGHTGITLGKEGAVCADVEWRIMIDGGRAERNPNFNFITVAAQALFTKLKQQISGNSGRYTRFSLQVLPVSEIAEREVGWRAVLRG